LSKTTSEHPEKKDTFARVEKNAKDIKASFHAIYLEFRQITFLAIAFLASSINMIKFIEIYALRKPFESGVG